MVVEWASELVGHLEAYLVTIFIYSDKAGFHPHATSTASVFYTTARLRDQ